MSDRPFVKTAQVWHRRRGQTADNVQRSRYPKTPAQCGSEFHGRREGVVRMVVVVVLLLLLVIGRPTVIARRGTTAVTMVLRKGAGNR